MEFTAGQIASFIGGKVIGDENALITGVYPIEQAMPNGLSFIAQEKFLPLLKDTDCSVVIVSEKFIGEEKFRPTLILVEDAYLAVQQLMKVYAQNKPQKTGIEANSSVAETAQIGENVYIGSFSYVSEKVKIGDDSQIYPQVFIGNNVKIGRNCIIYSGVSICDYSVIGDNCIIHSNTVIGADGFGFQPTEKGFEKIPQLGNVVIADDVEIGANCTIDRGTIGSTIIGKGTKIDNLIQIAHNVRIGENNVIAAQAGIAGSATIGDWNQIGGQSGIVGHIKIGNQVKIQAQSGVNNNVNDGEIIYGSPAFSAGDFRRNYVHFRNFTEIVKRIENLEKNAKHSDE